MSDTVHSLSSSSKAHRSSLTPGHSLLEKRLLPIDNKDPLSKQLQRFKLPDRKFFDIMTATSHAIKRVKFNKQQGAKHRASEAIPFLHPKADGLAIRRLPFAKGAERFAFLAREACNSSDPERCQFVGDWSVAKQSRHKQGKSSRGFHIKYMQLQQKAESLAKKFNQRLRFRELSLNVRLPQVEMLPCFVYCWEPLRTPASGVAASDDEHVVHWSYAEQECLVEPVLAPPLPFEKFNNNAGHVCESAAKACRGEEEMETLLSQQELQQIARGAPRELGKIDEEEEDAQSEDEMEEAEKEGCIEGALDPSSQEALDKRVREEGDKFNWGKSIDAQPLASRTRLGRYLRQLSAGEVAQSFSHHSFMVSKRECIVVDLQGKVVVRDEQQVLQLTDPAIHSARESRYQKRRWGLTDKGARGAYDFIRAHRCNSLCSAIGIAYQ